MSLGAQACLLLFEQDCGDGPFRRLVSPVAQTTANTPEEQLLQATVIRLLLERKLWSVTQAALHAPPGEPSVIDDRPALLRMIDVLVAAIARMCRVFSSPPYRQTT